MKKLADYIYVVDNFLSHSACDELIAKSEKMGYEEGHCFKMHKDGSYRRNANESSKLEFFLYYQ